ncbi:diacylglycerol/lipid kinase family protein [Pedobacter metabolipauper]|uniref:YegS/Rv2252/BmrU family lipid kinase n=1 Tax=Pedobacter metabolipauper TaxID=425513 RepID=A0A4R6SV48_9SPHI|nr:YegS/Rv2252/BmrU family lipid kinase [Pedobacter metabolipauper]TDQ09718.1 YegS/Rv2252/BmrU family lipid kinase [Pedobacter metabolipauper]
MEDNALSLKLLFIINPGSGSDEVNYSEEITAYFKTSSHQAEIYELPKDCALATLKETITNSKADRIVAVGGDGTVKLVAECLLETDTPIGIIPAGSANGMAKELNIPLTIPEAIDTAVNGTPKKIHAVTVNDELCIHLADIGFNAYLVKKFDHLAQRGMWGYTKAAWQALWSHNKMEVEFKIGDQMIRSEAAMVVIANATMYGTGVKINPEGRLDDEVFEVVLVKKYSVMEILKLKFTNMALNPANIELFQTTALTIKTKHKAHFQVDGEYIGKVNSIKASIILNAIHVIV